MLRFSKSARACSGGAPETRPITQRSPRQQALTWLPSEPPSCGSETNAWLGGALVPRTLRVRQRLGPAGLGSGARLGRARPCLLRLEQRGGEGRCLAWGRGERRGEAGPGAVVRAEARAKSKAKRDRSEDLGEAGLVRVEARLGPRSGGGSA